MTKFRNTHYAAGLIMSLFLILATWSSLIAPMFESPDESAHYLYADYLARYGHLPPLDYTNPHDEYHQPPLFYWLNSAWITLTGLPDPQPFLQKNPLAAISDTQSLNNKVAYRHHWEAEGWPWRGAVLALQLGRFTSIAMGAMTIWLAYLIGLQVFERARTSALATAALVAFNPQFIFISASLNNDNLVTLLITLSIWMAFRLTDTQTSKVLKTFEVSSLGAGLLVGAAILTKPTGWISGLVLGWVFLLALLKTWSAKSLYNLVAFALSSLLITGWWVYRNYSLYQDPLLQQYMQAYLNTSSIARPTLLQFLARLQEAEISFWATFGWLNITLAENIYVIYRGLARLALIGIGVGFIISRRRSSSLWLGTCRKLWLPSLVLLGLGVTMWQWVGLAGGIQGRLLFPGIVPLALLLTWGWQALVGSKWLWLGPLYSLGVAIYALGWVLWPIYTPPMRVTQLPAEATPIDIQFAGNLTLAGYSLPDEPLKPGFPFEVTLYWRPERPIPQPYAVFVHVIDETGLTIAQSQAYAGKGLLPADQWPVDRYLVDRVPIILPGLTYAPATGMYAIGLYNPQSGERLLLADGKSAATIGQFHVVGNAESFDVTHTIDFEQGVSLLGYDLSQRRFQAGETAEITLHWQTTQQFERNYTIFVHLLDMEGVRVAQHDSWPANGTAPTKTWPLAQPIADTHRMLLPSTLPAGAYQVWVGLYETKTGQRIDLQANEGLFDVDALLLTQLVVE